MVLQTKQTTVAYRCPHCGAGVLSMVNVFSLGADMIKLKCSCHKSEMTITKASDGRIRLSVPCILCPKPHVYTLSSAVFFGKDEFYLQCPYSDLNVCFLGEMNHVKAALAKSELELIELMEKSGISELSELRALSEENEQEALSEADPEMASAIVFVLSELEAEKRIYCKCSEGKYEYEETPGGILVRCSKCGAERLIPADRSLEAYSFIDSDSLYLK